MTTNNMLVAAEKLYALGITPLWLKTKSKAPVGKGWTENPRPEFKELVASYHLGYNMGVRLGSVSQVEDGYLAVLDVDVKSKDQKHRKAAYDKVRELVDVDVLESLPITRSGRGNGSAHVWFKTAGPVKPRRLAQSPESVEVFIPSIAPSKRDLAVLGKEKTDKGLRLRPAWELSLMGEGQQVVVPPSVHPDSGKQYEWQRELKEAAQLLTLDTSEWFAPSKAQESKAVHTSSFIQKYFEAQGPIEIVEVSVEDVRGLDPHIRALISGETDCEDRSVGLFEAAQGLVKAGCTRNEILTILSERGTFLGDACFEHRKTDDRMRAMEWLARYTVDKALREYSAELDFMDEVVVSSLTPTEAEAQENELVGQGSWSLRLERSSPNTGSRPKNTLANIMLILENMLGAENGPIFKYDEFRNQELYARDTPWGGKKDAPLIDHDTTLTKLYIIAHFHFEPSTDKLNEAIATCCRQNGFHPVRQWLKSLKWDGVKRIDTWLEVYGGASREPVEYLRAVSRKTLVALVKRVMEPGCKFDTVLVLEGNQGLGKSTLLSNLVGDEWFSDSPIDMKNKDSVVVQLGTWLHELGEMGTFKKEEDIEIQKAFLARRIDKIRMPYAKKAEVFPRQTVFIGTTNKGDYLKDLTGNRRFWPVHLTKCDHMGIGRDRDQLFAEAFNDWEFGEPLELPEELWLVAAGIQEERLSVMENPMMQDLAEAIDLRGGIEEIIRTPSKDDEFSFQCFRIVDAFRMPDAPWCHTGPGGANYKGTNWECQQAAEYLKKMGFRQVKKEDGEKREGRYWTVLPKGQKVPMPKRYTVRGSTGVDAGEEYTLSGEKSQ